MLNRVCLFRDLVLAVSITQRPHEMRMGVGSTYEVRRYNMQYASQDLLAINLRVLLHLWATELFTALHRRRVSITRPKQINKLASNSY